MRDLECWADDQCLECGESNYREDPHVPGVCVACASGLQEEFEEWEPIYGSTDEVEIW